MAAPCFDGLEVHRDNGQDMHQANVDSDILTGGLFAVTFGKPLSRFSMVAGRGPEPAGGPFPMPQPGLPAGGRRNPRRRPRNRSKNRPDEADDSPRESAGASELSALPAHASYQPGRMAGVRLDLCDAAILTILETQRERQNRGGSDGPASPSFEGPIASAVDAGALAGVVVWLARRHWSRTRGQRNRLRPVLPCYCGPTVPAGRPKSRRSHGHQRM